MTQIQHTPVEATGQDERQLLDALHGRGELGERLRKELEANSNKAAFKLELHFGKNRSASLEKLNTGCLTIWESGRRLHGGGDEKMYWCGYSLGGGYSNEEVCGKPIKTEFFGLNHVVCPHCQREQFLDPLVKQQHLKNAQVRKVDTAGLARMPIVAGEKMFNMTPKNLANLMAKLWRDLDSNADIYVKYHPMDIRCRNVEEVKKPDVYDKARARRNDGLLVYPLDRIVKDTLAGASLEKRFLALILA